jgi:hypothetical protein
MGMAVEWLVFLSLFPHITGILALDTSVVGSMDESHQENRRFLSSFFGNILSIFSSESNSDKRVKDETAKDMSSDSDPKTYSSDPKRVSPFTMINQSHQAAERVKASTIKNLGMWKIELENSESFKLHAQFESIRSVYQEDLTGTWRKHKDKTPIKEDTRSEVVGNGEARSKALTPGTFLYNIMKLPSIHNNPNLAVVWDGSESEMHAEPWKFGHALGRSGGRRSCNRWYAEVESGMGCYAGLVV